MEEQQQDHDHHGLNLSLTLKCPNHKNNHNVNPPPPPPPPPPTPLLHAPPPSKFLSSLLPCPYKFIPSPYNFLPPDHQIRRPPNFKPPSYAEMDKEIAEYIEEKRREAAAQDRERERQKRELEEELGMVSSPHSTVSTTSLSGSKRGEREDNIYDADRDLSSNYIVISEDEDGGDAAAAAARKKLRLSKDQAVVLEETFKEQMTLSTKQKLALAKQLDLRPRQVEVWFQNRRARTKLKQTEVDCGYLKRCCETLSAENKRLQKELAELRALKLSSQSYMNMYPPTTLTMCPQCERITAASSSSSTQASSLAGVANSNHQNPVGAYRPKPTSGIPFNKLISSDALDVRRPQL